MPARVLAEPALLMTMTDIAELAEVQRPVVTTWRRRHRGLPGAGRRGRGAAAVRPRGRWPTGCSARAGSSRERADQELSLFMLTGLAAQYDGPDVDRRRDRADLPALPRRRERAAGRRCR